MHSDPLPSILSVWVRSLVLYVFGGSHTSPFSALSDHDRWKESWRVVAIVLSQGHASIGSSPIALTSGGWPSSPLSLRTVSPSSELTLGGEVVYRPIGEALSHQGTVATA